MGLRALWTEFKTFAFKGNMIDLAVAVVIGAAFSGVINSLVQDVIMPGIIYLTSTAAEAKNAVANTVAPAAPTSKPAPTPEQLAAVTAKLASANKNLDDSTTPMVKAYLDVQKLQGMKADMPKDVQDQIDKASTDLLAIQQATGTAAPAPPPAPPAPPTQAVSFDWKIGQMNIGKFIGSLINFILIAAAVFITIVKLLGSVMKHMGPKDAPAEPVTKECPFCLSIIPIKARKCSHCTADLPATA